MKRSLTNFIFFAQIFAFFAFVFAASCRNSANTIKTAAPTVFYSVTFDLSGKGERFWQNVVEGETAIEPKDPECQGFVFDFWCFDENLEQKFDFQTPIEKNITLYAKWTKLDESQIALTFCKNDGSQEKIVLVVQKKTPFRFKPIFSAERMFVEKWLDDDGNEYETDGLAEGGFDEGKIFHAQWSKIKNAVVFCSQKDGTRISFNSEGIVDGVSFEYSLRDLPDESFGDWRKYEFGSPILLDKGKKCCFRGECGKALWQSDDCRIRFSVEGEVASWGNIMALVSHAATNKIPYENMFCRLFDGCEGLTESPDLPATELTAGCYKSMFRRSGLTKAPELPAENLAINCYEEMFYACKSLTKASELPATTLANFCYHAMFKCCESLTEAPELPATTLAGSCYGTMFSECKSLTNAPALPAAILADSCYENMFWGCESLKEPPELPATELANYCYRQMFYGCEKLLHSPKLPATELKKYCYSSMFSWCENLLDAPELPAETLQDHCYAYMFGGCEKIGEIKVHFTSWNDKEQATQMWLEGTATDGTFYCPRELSAARNDSHIPETWYINNF